MSSLFLSFTRLSWTVIYASMPSVETTSVVKVHAPNGFDIEFVLASGQTLATIGQFHANRRGPRGTCPRVLNLRPPWLEGSG
jgi:hypothetical protein